MDDSGADPGAWERLGDLLIARRVDLGFMRRTDFQRHLGLSHGRTLFDIEKAKRRNFDASTLAFVEKAYGWATGSIRAVLSGGEPTLAVDAQRRMREAREQARQVEDGQHGDADVGGSGQDEEIVLRLPVKPGTSARKREQMRRIAEASARAAVEALDIYEGE